MCTTKGSQLSAAMHDVPQMDGGDVGSWKIVAPEERSGLPVCQLNDSSVFQPSIGPRCSYLVLNPEPIIVGNFLISICIIILVLYHQLHIASSRCSLPASSLNHCASMHVRVLSPGLSAQAMDNGR